MWKFFQGLKFDFSFQCWWGKESPDAGGHRPNNYNNHHNNYNKDANNMQNMTPQQQQQYMQQYMVWYFFYVNVSILKQ